MPGVRVICGTIWFESHVLAVKQTNEESCSLQLDINLGMSRTCPLAHDGISSKTLSVELKTTKIFIKNCMIRVKE